MRTTTTSFVAGVMVGNSAPHLATAATGRQHLTPMGGRRSGPALNGLWGACNLAGGLWLLRRQGGGRRWDRRLLAFEAGVVAMAAWMASTERVLGTNLGD